MTFLELQNRSMDRLNLSTDDARTRIKNFLNERIRKIQTSVSLGSVRRGVETYTLTADTNELTLIADEDHDGIIKVRTVTIPSSRRIPLNQITLDQMRAKEQVVGGGAIPMDYAVVDQSANSVTLRFWPTPTADQDVQIDGIKLGADLVDDGDVAGLPEDFHDALIYGACADENGHWAKEDKFQYYENLAEKRVREMRYFIQKSIYLHRHQQSESLALTSWWWFYGAPTVSQ